LSETAERKRVASRPTLLDQPRHTDPDAAGHGCSDDDCAVPDPLDDRPVERAGIEVTRGIGARGQADRDFSHYWEGAEG
jgi:hypothetical protein